MPEPVRSKEDMALRISLWIVAALLLVSNDVLAYGGGAPHPGAADGIPAEGRESPSATDNLSITVELPRSSPYLQGLPESVAIASDGGSVRLRVPVFSAELAGLPLAEVDGVPITLRDLRRSLMPSDEDGGGETSRQGAYIPVEVLGRLVDVRLIAREGREIGLEELPEVRKTVEVFINRRSREHLMRNQVEGIEPDEDEVQRLYEEAAREWRIKGMVFQREEDAAAFRTVVAGGGSFDDAAKGYVADGKATAKGAEEGGYITRQDLPPETAANILEYPVGSVLPVMAVKGGFGVIQLQETRLPENPEARSQARRRARNFVRNRHLVEYTRQLTEKYVKVDKERMEGLNLDESVENFERLLQDGRTVATVEGESPVTVADLARGVSDKFYHGIGEAIEQGKLAEMKVRVLGEILRKRVLLKEAKAQGLDNTPEFLEEVSDYEDSLVFGAFIERVLRPEVKFSEDDLRKYYEQHIEQYTDPEMIRLRSLVFASASAARSALDKLNKGTDFFWMKANADGQVPPGTEEVTRFSEGFVTEKSVPEPVRQAVATMKTEDAYGIYSQEGKYFHVLNVVKRIPPRAKPMEEVQASLARNVYKEKIDRAFLDWTDRLKKVYDVKVYARE